MSHTPSPSVTLRSCWQCQMEYFSPAIQGDDHFYSELTSSCSGYYVENKWEFEYVRSIVKPSDNVLDVACGKGALLNSIANSVLSATGVDTNPDTTNANRIGKVRIVNETIEDFALQNYERFDACYRAAGSGASCRYHAVC